MSKKSVFLSPVIMTFIMASMMSGIMGLIFTGPSMEWPAAWPTSMALTGAIRRACGG